MKHGSASKARSPASGPGGAVCPAGAVAAGRVLPCATAPAMNADLAEIARTVAPGAHAVLILDGAGWHGAKGLVVPDTITLLPLPPYAPELNPVENPGSGPGLALGLSPRQQARHHRLRQL